MSSEASQPLISSTSHQADNTYSSTTHSIKPTRYLFQTQPTHSTTSTTPIRTQHPPTVPATTPAHWYSACLPFSRTSSSGSGGAAYDDKALIPSNIVYKNWHRSHYSDFYYHMLRLSWLPFVLVVLGLFFAQVLFFAITHGLLLLLVSAAAPSSPAVSFGDLLLLHLGVSAGYGTGPFAVLGKAEHLLLSIEALARTIYFTLVTGILYARFSRPVPRIRFSKCAFVCRHHGQRSLIVRIANDRLESRQTKHSPHRQHCLSHCPLLLCCSTRLTRAASPGVCTLCGQ